MPPVFRYFGLLAALFSVVNLLLVERRLAQTVAGPLVDAALRGRARNVVRAFFGGMACFFLGVTALEFAGGYDSVLFFFDAPRTSPYVWGVWALLCLFWGMLLVGLWRPAVTEATAAAGLVRGGGSSPAAVRRRGLCGHLRDGLASRRLATVGGIGSTGGLIPGCC